MSTTKSCASNGGAGCSRGFVREKCHKCNLGSIACDMCHAGSLVTQHFHQLLQQHQLNRQQPNQQQQQRKQRRGSKDNSNHEHQHHRLSSSSSTASSSSRSSSACSTPTTGSPRSSLSVEAASPIAGCGPLATTTTIKMLQRTGSASAPIGDTAPPPSAVNSAPVPLPKTSSVGGPPLPSPSPTQTPSPPLPSTIQHSQISSPSPRPMTIKTFSISYQLPLPSGHPQKSLVSSSPISPIPAKDISLSVITDCPDPSYTPSAPSSPTANMKGPLFFATTRSSTSSSPPPLFPHPSLSISSSIPPPSPTAITTITPNSRCTPPLPSSSTYSVPSSPSPYGPSSLPCIFCFNGRKACEECFGLGYVQRICQECLRDRHRQQSRRRMKHTSLPNAWNQFGTKIKEQLFSHSSSNATTVPGTSAAATTASTATTSETNRNASSSWTSPPFSSSMLFPLQRRNTSANGRTGGTTLLTATTAKTGIAGLSLKNKWQRQQRSKSMVSLPLTTNPPSLSGHSSSPTTPTAVVPPSSSLVPSTALTGTASLSSASNAIIAMTGITTIMTAGSGAEMGLRPVDEGECDGPESTGSRNLNSSSDTTSDAGDNDDAGVGGREGRGKKVVGRSEFSINNSNNNSNNNNNNNNSQLIPTATVKKSFKATVMGALKLPNLFQGHLHSTTTSTTNPSNTNTNNSNDNNRSRRRARGDKGGAGNRGSMDHVSNRDNNNNNNNGNQNASNSNSSSGGGGYRLHRGHTTSTSNSGNNRGRQGGVTEGGDGSGVDGGRRGSRVPHRRQWSLSLPSLSMSSLPPALTAA